jgi:hypothetical protein
MRKAIYQYKKRRWGFQNLNTISKYCTRYHQIPLKQAAGTKLWHKSVLEDLLQERLAKYIADGENILWVDTRR